ncbi:unnamed protein product, partial [Ectocarpus fasciculatus]
VGGRGGPPQTARRHGRCRAQGATGTREEVVRRGGQHAVPVRATRGPNRADCGGPQGACRQQYHPHQQGDQAEDQRDRDRVAGPSLQVVSDRQKKGG